MRRHMIRAAILAAAATLALTACATPPVESPAAKPTGSATARPTMSAHSAVDPQDAPEVLQFSATTLDGDDFEGTSLYGQPTIVWFWASWCSICNAEAPLIADAISQLPEGVQAIGIPGRSDQAGMEAFVAKYHLEDMVQVVDPDGFLWSNFMVASQPAVALIDAEGNVKTLPGSIGTAGFLQAAESIA